MLFRHGVLQLTHFWDEEGESVLASSFVAWRLHREEACEDLPVDETLRRFERLKRQPMSSWKIRQFVSDAGLRANLWEMNDWEVANLVRLAIERRSACGLREIDKAGKPVNATTEQRRLVRKIEKQTGGHLNFSGRQYKLVVDVDLGQVPGRNSYEVAGRDEALRVLDGLAKEAGTAGDLGALLVQASAKLTQDWRPPRQPDGLILLRRIRQLSAPVKDTGPAITPSQMKAMIEAANREKGPLWVRIDMAPKHAQQVGATFVLRSSDQSIAIAQTVRDDMKPGSETIDLLYEGLWKDLSYSLRIEEAGGVTEIIFANAPYSQLASLAGATGDGDSSANEPDIEEMEAVRPSNWAGMRPLKNDGEDA